MSFVIGIAGGTGSGKTTVAQRIGASVPATSVSMIEYDAYYRDRPELSYEERCALNYDHPDSLETELLVGHLRELRSGSAVLTPVYDFTNHLRQGKRIPVEPTPVIVVEGILTLVDERLRAMFDLKVFVDTDPDIRAFRRIRRDIEHRGRTFQSVRDQYYKTVRPMHLQFVEPSKRWADVIIPEGGDNNVGVDLIVAKVRSVIS
ncbi:MAG: uridine kinase [Myxococcota bacterium]